MKRFLVTVLCLSVAAISWCRDISLTKPVEGTWINLFWQDERNNYMNPSWLDNTSPELWRLKVNELNEIGVKYLVIMAVANEGKAAYPSEFMEHSYPDGRESPVEAIMAAADDCGMHVFMSCGWAKNMLDNLSEPAVMDAQLKIMEETAGLFSHHESFFGWYLPVEDSFEPVLSENAVRSVNRLAAQARSFTPGKEIMISPYGLCNADMESPLFAERIKALDVDIIAYQDEVGCVREPMPMKRMKEHFKILGEIHRDSGIRFWANIESFTWDRETNSWYSTLVPAAFGRYLSQLCGVSQAGVETVLSFSVFGIYDKPGSPIPLGQPEVSAAAWNDYCEWLRGEGRWPYLEQIFHGNTRHAATGCPACSGKADMPGLTDGAVACESVEDTAWTVFPKGKMDVTVDLGRQTEIDAVAVRFLNYRPADVAIPPLVSIYVSCDGKHYDRAAVVSMEAFPNDRHDCWADIALTDGINAEARWVKVVASNEKSGGRAPAIYCDEIFVNPDCGFLAGDFVKADTSAVKYVGRTEAEDGKVSFDWAGTSMETIVSGTDRLFMKAASDGECYFNVFVDGKQTSVVHLTGDTLVCLASGLSGQSHEIRLQKRSEGEFGKATIEGYLAAEGAVLSAPPKRGRMIEFIGDSITCGYGTEGKDRDEPFMVSTENCDLSYACIIARYFDADYTLISHSGRGAARNYGDTLSVSQVTMKDRMMRTFDMDAGRMWDFGSCRPDIVVINLGSNDFSTEPHPSESEFKAAYHEILSRIRKNYGDVPVLCVSPRVGEPALTYIREICSSADDPNVYFGGSLHGVYNYTTDLGASWHPGVYGHRKIAMTLIPRISTITGWDMPDKPIE